jgi:hypothetical protein
MPGLLDDDLFNDPKKLGLLTMGLSLLSTPGRFGESFGKAGLQGVQATRGAMKDAQQSQMAKLQLDEVKQRAMDAQKAREMEMRIAQTAQNFLRPPQPARPGTADLQSMMPQGTSIGAMQPIPEQRGGFDTQGFLNALPSVPGMNPLQAIETQAKYRQMLGKENQINKLDAKDFTPTSLARFAQSGNYGDLERLDKLHFGDTGGQIAAFNPFTGTKVTATPKTGDPFKDLVIQGDGGQLVPNMPLVGAKTAISRAGAPVNKIDIKTGESIANQVGPMLKESRASALAGAKLMESSNRILESLDKNQGVYVGPGADLRLKGAQVADLLGITGKDTKEKIVNTRKVIQGMAEQAVAARSQLGSQAQISNSEQELLNRATSGSASDMTVEEIRQLAKLSQRMASQMYELHSGQIQNMSADPSISGLAKFYNVPKPPNPYVGKKDGPQVIDFGSLP